MKSGDQNQNLVIDQKGIIIFISNNLMMMEPVFD